MKNIHIVVVFALVACNRNGETIKPQVKPLTEAVYASGFVVSRDEYEVISQAEGYLDEKLVRDGDLIRKGDPLFVVDSDQQSSRYQLAKENYEMASGNYRDDSPVLGELKAARETARSKMQFDSLNYVRYSNLLKSNATSQSEFDRMRLAYENSTNEFILQSSRYKKTKNQLYIDLENAKSQLQIASDESGRYIVRSLVDGKVFRTMKEKGELVRRNEAIAVIGRADAFYLELSVDELDIQRVKEGQEIVVKIDAYPAKIFRATVDRVFPMINQAQQSLRVDGSFIDPLPGAFSGLAVEANIIVRKKEKALVIPKSALLPGDSVFIETDDGEKKVKVVKGIETLDEVEIVEGLDSGKKLLVNH
jgi:multidrug efflux pump subunit AcrA (membrane-fusion protein)